MIAVKTLLFMVMGLAGRENGGYCVDCIIELFWIRYRLQGCAGNWGTICRPRHSHSAIRQNTDPAARSILKCMMVVYEF